MNHANQIGKPLFVLMCLNTIAPTRKHSKDHGKLPQGYVNTWDTGASICTDTCSADEYECEISERRIIVRARR